MIFLDCQTTGMHPSIGSLLELAWLCNDVASGDHEDLATGLMSRLIHQPPENPLSSRISKLTGLTADDLVLAPTKNAVFQEFLQLLSGNDHCGYVVIHHSPFEIPFLKELFLSEGQLSELPFQILDSAKIAKRLLPSLPSWNIRALAGYFGLRLDNFKRAGAHVRATQLIWKNLVPELERLQLTTPADVQAWIKQTAIPKSVRYQYRIEKEFRLKLPNRPGIYRMLTHDGSVLYVGKATSLRDRVNSYFRGKKRRDRKKLEMLTQVSNVEFTETDSALEAALLENDEIKRLDPPYNICLKTGDRKLLFYSCDFGSSSEVKNADFSLGPYRPANAIEQLKLLAESLRTNAVLPVFYQMLVAEDFFSGFVLFCLEANVHPEVFLNIRSALAWSIWHLRKQKLREIDQGSLPDDDGVSVAAEVNAEVIAETPELLAARFERLMFRAAQTVIRCRRMKRFQHSEVKWLNENGQWKNLPQQGAIKSISDYDRISILLTELNKYQHEIDRRQSDSTG
jgi:DNA polymerase-3 subunit epsilon